MVLLSIPADVHVLLASAMATTCLASHRSKTDIDWDKLECSFQGDTYEQRHMPRAFLTANQIQIEDMLTVSESVVFA